VGTKDAPAELGWRRRRSYSGGSVPQGAIDYIGPCPPAGARHRSVWMIEALDKDGKTLARATAEGPFPPP